MFDTETLNFRYEGKEFNRILLATGDHADLMPLRLTILCSPDLHSQRAALTVAGQRPKLVN
jgi:hypothetical protein